MQSPDPGQKGHCTVHAVKIKTARTRSSAIPMFQEERGGRGRPGHPSSKLTWAQPPRLIWCNHAALSQYDRAGKEALPQQLHALQRGPCMQTKLEQEMRERERERTETCGILKANKPFSVWTFKDQNLFPQMQWKNTEFCSMLLRMGRTIHFHLVD